MTAVSSTLPTPRLTAVVAHNWKLAIAVAVVVSAISMAGLPAAVSFWVVGATAALVAAAFTVNAYRRHYFGALLVAPAIAVLFVMNIFPLLWSLGLSFFAYQANQQTIRFVGLGNYVRILTNDLAAHATWGALINTAMFVVFTVSAQMIVGFLLAVLFAKQFPLRKYLLILVLTPMMLSVVASGVFFTYYYDPTFGILSYVINSISGNQFIHEQQSRCRGGNRFRRRMDVVALRHAPCAGGPRLGAEIPLRGRCHRPYFQLAAILDDHLPLHPRPSDAGPSLPHHRGIQAGRSRHPPHQGRQRHTDDLLSLDPHRQRAEQDE